MEKSSIRNQPLRIKLFLTYALFFIFPLLLMGFIAFEWLSSVTQSQTVSVYQNSLKSTREYTDRQFADLKKLSVSLSQTSWVKRYMTKVYSVYEEEQLDIRRYNEELLIYNVANDFIDEIALLFHNRDNVISSMGVNEFEYFFEDNFNISELTYDQFTEVLNGNNQASLIYTKGVSTYGLVRQGIIYLQSYPFDLKSDFRATLLIFINRNSLDKTLSALFPDDDAHVYVLNEKNELIAGSNTDPDAFEKILGVISSDEDTELTGSISVNGAANLIFLESSENTGWKYAALIPKSAVLKEVRRVQTIILLLVIVSSLSGLLVSFLLAKRNYEPVDGILMALGGRQEINANEYEWIKGEIVSLVNQDAQLKERMEHDKPTLIDAYFQKLITAKNGDREEIIKILRWFDIRFESPMYSCINVSLKGNADLALSSEKLAEIGMLDEITVHMTGYDNERIMICCYSDNEQLRKYINAVHDYLSGAGMASSLGIGSSYTSIDMINKSYSEAKQALDYRLLDEEKCSLLFYETINKQWYYYYPADKEAALLQNLRSGNYSAAVSIFNEMLLQNIQNDHINMMIVRYFFFYSMVSANALCGELELEDIDCGGNELILKSPDIEEMKEHMLRKYREICERVSQDKKSHNTKLSQQIYEHIEKNFPDEALTLASTADKFGISASYLSRFFKEQYGCNFLDYVNRKRIAAAKQLLCGGGKTINEIVSCVGYNNNVTFRRLFRKYEGISPAQYRDRMCH